MSCYALEILGEYMEFFIILAILVYFLRKNSVNHHNNSSKSYKKSRQKQSKWKSEWIWNEEKQLWVHPLSGDTPVLENQEKTEKQNVLIDFSTAYQAKNLLTKNEWVQYKKLKEIADVKGYVICPKVRLFDVIEPIKGHDKYKTLMYKIQAKHIDFLICDKNMHIKAIIELDDSSHDNKDRKERDQFFDLILHSVGYKVIHTKCVMPDVLDLV